MTVTKRANVVVNSFNQQTLGCDINSNLASLAASGSKAKTSSRVVGMAQYEEHVLGRIDQINADWRNASTLADHLGHLKNLFMIDVPESFRPGLFHLLNNLVSALMNGYGKDEKIFRASFNMMTQLKELIDKKPQSNETAADSEWQEFERCVYLLSDWEDLIRYGSEASPVPLHLEKE